MRFSALVYKLKRAARIIARRDGIALNAALDRLAAKEGFRSWSQLAAKVASPEPSAKIISQLKTGDLVLLAARPGQGKATLGIELAARAGQIGMKGFFFTLDYTQDDVTGRLANIGFSQREYDNTLEIDTSDEICADYIAEQMAKRKDPAIIVVDYLQILDQNRMKPSIDDQLRTLREYAKATSAIIVLISQVDRAFELTGKPMPDLSDIRRPNPLDLSPFDKACFLHNGQIRLNAVA